VTIPEIICIGSAVIALLSLAGEIVFSTWSRELNRKADGRRELFIQAWNESLERQSMKEAQDAAEFREILVRAGAIKTDESAGKS